MNPLGTVEAVVAKTAARLRWLRGWTGLWKGALAGAALYLLALAVFKLVPIPRDVVTVAGWLGLAAAPVGFLVGFWRRTSPTEAARWLDERQGLQQRLSTALEVGRRDAPGPWRDLVVADATAAAAQVNAARLLPVGLPRLARVLAAVLAVIVGLGFLPELRTQAHLAEKKQAEVIKEVGRQLSTLTKRQLEQRPPAMEPTRRSLEDVKELGDRLTQAKLTRDDALKDLAKATDQLKQQAGELARNPVLKKLEQAARTPSGQPPPSSSQLQKQIDSLQKQLGEKAPDADGADKLQKELQKLKDAAKGMADNSSANTPAAREQLSNMASELARKAEEMGLPLPSLDEAVAALQSAQVEQFLRDLQVAEKDLQKMADLARQLAKLQQQAEKLGKDLAEQLQNGQAQAAVESLKQMQALLKQPGLTPEQEQRLRDEIAKALKPAEQYGDVGKHLQKALSQAKSGDKQSAQQSLAAAQKELEDLLKDMGDMQALMASMQDLKQAQLCVGNCQGWGSQPGKGGAGGKSGKPRGNRGFGDWADDSAWAVPDQIADSWDNSGLERKDKDAKGQTERDPSKPDNLAPTKVKGQMQPGGPMPSITLKGLSIKGDSKVAYTEAVNAAQVDAQSALNQEQVPKAYRNSVRDYFDDLKK